MLILNEAEKDVVRSSTQLIGVFFRLATDPVIRLWLGIGNIRVGVNAQDASGAIYQGFGVLNNVPDVSQLINGVADRVDFTISGVSAQAMQVAAADAVAVHNASCALGISFFDGGWQQLGPPKWLFRGIADVVTISQDNGDAGVIRSISLSVGSLFTGRRRRALSYLTNRDQQSRSPGDRICERTTLYGMDTDKVWPRFDS